MISALIHWLYPSTCIQCGRVLKPFRQICSTCLTLIAPIVPPLCLKCGKPITGLPVEPDFQGLCPDCLTTPRAFDAARAPAIYTEPLSQWIIHLKYRHKPRIGSDLGHWMAQQLEEWIKSLDPMDGVTFVPLHRKRLRQREYNQAEWIARALAQTLDLACLPLLRRTHFEGAQVGKSRWKRWEQTQKAFKVVNPHVVKGKSWLIVDDVHTTGATLHACSMALKQAGARHVYALTLATTPTTDAGVR